MKFKPITFFLLVIAIKTNAQPVDSLRDRINSLQLSANFSIKPYFLPLFLTSYGLIALKNEDLKELDNSIKEEVWTDTKHKPVLIDNYLQYAPGFSVFCLRSAGIDGKNNLKDEIILYLASNAVMASIVNPLKLATHLQRPDGFGKNAFPSGHTATAFTGAEFLNQEYKDRSPWYSLSGYLVASGVGFFRVYNNRHWMRDVVSGAGIGMLSTKLTYWLYPKVVSSEKKKREKNLQFQMSRFGD